MWLSLALLSGGLYTVQGLLSRQVLKDQTDAWAFSFYFSLIGATTALPFMVASPHFSHSVSKWFLLLVIGVLIVIQNWLNFKATNYLAASIQGALTKFRLLWVLLIGVIWLGETLTPLKLLGTALTLLTGLVLYVKPSQLYSKVGLSLTLAATGVYAVVIAGYKILFQDFNSATLTFLIFLIPALINLFAMPEAVTRIKKLATSHGKLVFTACFFGGLANLAMNQALATGEASKVLVIIEAFLVVVLIGEQLFLKERADVRRKIIAVILATIGAICIRLAQ